MSNSNNKIKSAWNSSSNPWNISSNNSKNIDASDWNSQSNKWYIAFNPSKKFDEYVKQSSLEEHSFKTIGTRPTITCHVSPIGPNVVIPNTNRFREKKPDHDWKIVDNTITCIINHNLWYRTTVNILLMIEEFNNILTNLF